MYKFVVKLTSVSWSTNTLVGQLTGEIRMLKELSFRLYSTDGYCLRQYYNNW